jgi:hypothetical protein
MEEGRKSVAAAVDAARLSLQQVERALSSLPPEDSKASSP